MLSANLKAASWTWLLVVTTIKLAEYLRRVAKEAPVESSVTVYGRLRALPVSMVVTFIDPRYVQTIHAEWVIKKEGT